MARDRVNEKYRGHSIIAAIQDGRFKGRIYKDREVIHECEGESIEGVKETLQSFIDDRLLQIAEQRESPPDAEEYVRAFRRILDDLNDSYLKMLKAHYRAENHEITATQLAKAAGYANYSAANLHYGRIGYMLNEELPIKLPKRESNNKPIATYALAMAGDQTGPEENWVWKLRPGVAYAIETLGLNT